ncbi:MAG: methyltransferase family protein [Terracidiphilus sp.]
MLRVALFFAASAAILPVSWRSLRDWRTHGFYRFFAFELLLALILLNAPLWWRDPFSWRQLASYLFGIISIGLAIEGFRLLRVIGRPRPTTEAGANDPIANHPIENTTTLVTVGAYRWIRHPLYASLLALACCAWLKDPLGADSMALTVGSGGFLVATAIAEERENLTRFGAVYGDYMKRTRRLIPYLF